MSWSEARAGLEWDEVEPPPCRLPAYDITFRSGSSGPPADLVSCSFVPDHHARIVSPQAREVLRQMALPPHHRWLDVVLARNGVRVPYHALNVRRFGGCVDWGASMLRDRLAGGDLSANSLEDVHEQMRASAAGGGVPSILPEFTLLALDRNLDLFPDPLGTDWFVSTRLADAVKAAGLKGFVFDPPRCRITTPNG